ncbi:ATP-binding protein [Streptomyces sp. RKAG293]|uniref:ATP-binding protein n=1 Tax=Streptomyces sp. RKAG293 TaxID=2893403 RepID=UPI002033D0D6|nr:ATP-binding protein [Streptomyces sp. RKAG293]MCM2419105.1 ATP-binding protein [Streptomyces sp. RKAG293]
MAPLYCAADCSGEAGSIADARHCAGTFMDRLAAALGVPVSDRLRYDVQLVVTELVTNANRHTHGPCLLELEGAVGSVIITVSDSSTALPRAFPPDPQRVGGHGIEILQRICQELIVERVPVGKRIRAVLAIS